MGLQSLKDDEPLPAHVAGKRPFPRVDPLMVVVRGFVEKGPAACLAVVLHLTCVDLLVSFQRACGIEALAAGLAAERRHVDRCAVLPIDDSAVTSFSGSPFDDPAASFIMSYSLVLL